MNSQLGTIHQMAMEFIDEAVRLIQLAFSSQPHPAMKPELEALLLTCQRTN